MILFLFFCIIRYFYIFSFVYLKNFFVYLIFLSILYLFRLTPAYAMMIGFYATLLYKIGTGPIWDRRVSNEKNFCRNNWYINLLYVNNFVNVPDMVNYFFD